jgi:hypothetical protein
MSATDRALFRSSVSTSHGRRHLSKMSKGNWFGNYRELFGQCRIDLDESGVDLTLLEQAILTRNDFTHNVGLLSNYTYQRKDHSEKYPKSEFLDRTVGPRSSRA